MTALDGPPEIAVVFSCCTRVGLLGDRVGEEVAEISAALGGAPAGGFYTCGEFGRVTGSSGIHNSSVAIIAF
jgi:small ligand-binding sensory domain FIST